MTDQAIGSFVSQQIDAALLEVSFRTSFSSFQGDQMYSRLTGQTDRQADLSRTRSWTSCWHSFWNKGTSFVSRRTGTSVFTFYPIRRTISVYQMCHRRQVWLHSLAVENEISTHFLPGSRILEVSHPRCWSADARALPQDPPQT